MVKALLDTNILIDYLRGIPAARNEMNLYTAKAISIVTWMEVMIGAPATAERATRDFLDSFPLVELDQVVAARAVELQGWRRSLRLADCRPAGADHPHLAGDQRARLRGLRVQRRGHAVIDLAPERTGAAFGNRCALASQRQAVEG